MRVTVTRADTDEMREQCYGIRTAVFVEEQNVPIELEMDEYDREAVHFLMTDDESGFAVGCARLLDKGGLAKIGRVAIARDARGRGLGLVLMRSVIDEAQRLGFREAILDSQTYAIPFYEKLGFVAEGDEFDDAGIAHFRMRRTL